MRKTALLMSFVLLSTVTYAQERIALVVGNAAYEHTAALKNPVNDASDIAATLENLGFSVNRLYDANRGDIQKAVDGFKTKATKTGIEVALFYYSGHGVEYEGVNYIIPVTADITDEYQLLDQAVSLDRVTRALEQGRAQFNMVVLDACRDNPFFNARGSGSRGLAPMSGGGKGSMIVFATSPGDVAQDGKTRNSPFTQAFIQHAATPGLEISTLMRQVNGTVRELTSGRQTPWFNASYTGEVFLSAVEDLPETQARAEAVNRELAALTQEITQREAAIAAARSQNEKRRLEAEQQRAQAEEAARRMQAEQLTEIAARAKAVLENRKAEEALRQQMENQLAGQRASLTRQATERRAELEKLKRQGLDATQVWEQLTVIAGINKAIAQVQSRFDDTIKRMETEVGALYAQQAQAIRDNNPKEPFETQKEYEALIAGLTRELKAKEESELTSRREELNNQRKTEIAAIREQLKDAKTALDGSRFTLDSSATSVTVNDFNAEEKHFPMQVQSRAEKLSFIVPVSYPLKGSGRNALREEYYRVYSADKSGGLAGEIDYSVFELYTDIWVLQPNKTRVINLLENDAELANSNHGGEMLVSTEGEVKKINALLHLESGTENPAKLTLNGQEVGQTGHTLLVPEGEEPGTIKAEYTWPNGKRRIFAISLKPGINPMAVATPEGMEQQTTAVFSGLPAETRINLNGTEHQTTADQRQIILPLPEGSHPYRISGRWLFREDQGHLEIDTSRTALVNKSFKEMNIPLAGEIALTLEEKLPAKHKVEIGLYATNGTEMPVVRLPGQKIQAKAPPGDYLLGISRSDDPYISLIKPIRIEAENTALTAINELPYSAHHRLNIARGLRERAEKKSPPARQEKS